MVHKFIFHDISPFYMYNYIVMKLNLELQKYILNLFLEQFLAKEIISLNIEKFLENSLGRNVQRKKSTGKILQDKNV